MSKVSFELDGKTHNLYFGMDAYEIVSEKAVKATIENNVSNFKMCSYIIFGGWCNWCVLNEMTKPSYAEAYILTESIFTNDESLQKVIFDAWNDSVANQQLLKLLNVGKKKAEAKKGKTLTKSERLRTAN